MIEIRLTGDEELDRKLRQLQVFLNDLRPFWPLLVPLFVGWMRVQFESEGAWGGGPWAPLSPVYAAEKARTHPGRSILIRESVMRGAASQPRREASPTQFLLWIDDEKAGYHQEGGGRLPARPLIPEPLPQGALRDIDQAAEEYMGVLVRRLGLR